MRTFIGALGLVFGLSLFAGTALAQPQIPGTFFGSVTVDGAPAADGVEVRAIVNGQDCSQAAPGTRPVIRDGATAAYVINVVHESQRAGCARDGSIVTFTIGGRNAVQSAPWKPGPNQLDISVGAAPPIPLPSPTGTIGALVATQTAEAPPPTSATLVRPSGTPPTDDVTFNRTPLPPGSTPTAAAGKAVKEDGGSPVLLVAIVILVGLAAAGAGAGFALSRRRGGGKA